MSGAAPRNRWQAAEEMLARVPELLADPLHPTPALIARLRQSAPAAVVASAIDLAAARHRGTEKFARAKDLWLDREGLEQASSEAVAAHKAQRFADALSAEPSLAAPIIDLCCGIGGDAMALGRVARSLLVVDTDMQRALAARHNTTIAGGTAVAAVADAGQIFISESLVHLDPARRIESARGGRQRLWRYEDHRPGPEVIERVVRSARGAAVKFGPGLDVQALPQSSEHELEWIAHGRTLRQTVWWSGGLVRHPGWHTATELGSNEPCTVSGTPSPLTIDTVPAGWFDDASTRYLWIPHPAIERAMLVETLIADQPCYELAPGLGVLGASVPSTDIQDGSTWLPSYRVHAELPWRTHRVKAWLAQHNAGEVTVRTRGGAVDANQAARELRCDGIRPYTVFVFRLGAKRLRAFVTERHLELDQSTNQASSPG